MGLHGVCMIAAYGVLLQLAEIIANHTSFQTGMKTNYFNSNAGGHADGYRRFNTHRALGGGALLCAVVGIIAIFYGYGWTVFDYGRHAYYGLAMIGLTIIQIFLRVCFPAKMKIVHRWLGRFMCFWAFWCLYTGKEADLLQDGKDPNVEGEYWLTYVLFLVFYGIRLYYFVLRCLKKDGALKVALEDDNKDEQYTDSKPGTTVELSGPKAESV